MSRDDEPRSIGELFAALEQNRRLESELQYAKHSLDRLRRRKSVRVALRVARALGRLKARPKPSVPVEALSTELRQSPGATDFPSASKWYAARVKISSGKSRVTVLIDSLGPDSLFGGTATAVVLGVLLGRRLNRSVRILTQHSHVGVQAALHELLGLLLNEESPAVPEITALDSGAWGQ